MASNVIRTKMFNSVNRNFSTKFVEVEKEKSKSQKSSLVDPKRLKITREAILTINYQCHDAKWHLKSNNVI